MVVVLSPFFAGAKGVSSNLSGFHKRSTDERLGILADMAGLSPEDLAILRGQNGLSLKTADQMIENVVGIHALPFGIAAHFLINEVDVLVPMVTEEPSVVAGASLAAKLVRAGGGFTTDSTPALMIGQIQVLDVANPAAARFDLLAKRDELLATANATDPVLAGLGGGAQAIEVRCVDTGAGEHMVVLHLIVDTRDAMGANAVNTALEALAPLVERISGGRVLLRILSNLSDRRLARAKCVVPADALSFESRGRLFSGKDVVRGVVEASRFAAADPYRAATHNKGIMNGVDAVVMATGNDWRAVEAGAHAYAARDGNYKGLSQWDMTPGGDLLGTLEMPMAVGIVGGATRSHPVAGVALKILRVTTARALAETIVAVGLAQNLAALRALATEGIQRGHMELHARQVAMAAGAVGDQVTRIAAQMVAEGQVRPERAQTILADGL